MHLAGGPCFGRYRFEATLAEHLRNESAFLGELVFGSADTIELSCDSHGSSVPVSWFKDGIGIAPPSRARTGQKLLKIMSVSYDGSGLYSCKARHSDQVLGNLTARGTDMAGGDGYPASRLGSRADTLGYRMGPQRAKYEAERGKSSQRSSEVLKEILKGLDKEALEMDRETAENEALQEAGSHAVPVSGARRGTIQSVEVPVCLEKRPTSHGALSGETASTSPDGRPARPPPPRPKWLSNSASQVLRDRPSTLRAPEKRQPPPRPPSPFLQPSCKGLGQSRQDMDLGSDGEREGQ
ncbi:uncharacterized protein LOC142051156 [Phalacrocorax aristotelis]|uniref:uncharacterized protein LOC142051156 n=1 Tax=Phalacrocorax aristotelis TaxID=126867 RepID=UPI003F4CAC08